MSQTVKVHYPNPSNFESAFLVIDSKSISLPITYEQAKEMTVELAGSQGTEIQHSNGTLTVDATLAAELYAACVEIIVDVELGEDLAVLEAEEQNYAYC